MPQGFFSDKPITKIINNQLKEFTQELNVVLTKIENWKVAGLHVINSEVWKIRKFNNLLLWYWNAIYN